MIAPSLEQQVTVLQHRLEEAFERIGELEKEVAAGRKLVLESAAPALPAIDSPQMVFALQLCATVFPGSNTKVETDCDADQASVSWYTLVVRWKAEPTAAIEKESKWHELFDQAYPIASPFFRLFVALE